MKELVSSSVELLIPFHDVDAMKIVWHGHYVKYFEIARCELLKKIKYDYPQMADSGYLWPVVDLQVKYISPIEYDDCVTVSATLVEYENRIRIRYQVISKSGKVLTKGQTTQVAVNAATEELEFCSPEILTRNVKEALNNED